jgi:hypothetical protein
MNEWMSEWKMSQKAQIDKERVFLTNIKDS